MPVFNGEKYVSAAIESILHQTYRNFEFIIVDDCSTDHSLTILEKWRGKDRRIKLFRNKKQLGISRSRNLGIAHAKGRMIMNMDHDDLCRQKRMSTQVKYLEKHPQVGIVGSDIGVINEKGIQIGTRHFPKDDLSIRLALVRYSPFTHPSTMIRYIVYQKAGNYNKDFEPADDYELYYRIGTRFRFGNIDQQLLKHRIYSSATTMTKTRLMIHNTLKAKWHAITKLGYKPDAAAALIALGQLALLFMPHFILEKIVLSQYDMGVATSPTS
jgi:glycosyltransferase involved in cell wall biosynthesis